MKKLPVLEAVRAYVAARWEDETDAMIAKRFGVSRQYVMTARKRMGLVKNLIILSEIRAMYRKKPRKRLVRSLTPYEKEKRHTERLAARMEVVEPHTPEEWDAFMRAKGYKT